MHEGITVPLKIMHTYTHYVPMVSASTFSVEFLVGFLQVFGCLLEDMPIGVCV